MIERDASIPILGEVKPNGSRKNQHLVRPSGEQGVLKGGPNNIGQESAYTQVSIKKVRESARGFSKPVERIKVENRRN